MTVGAGVSSGVVSGGVVSGGVVSGGVVTGGVVTGGVVVGGATLRAVPGLRATSLGEIEVKGKREPLDAYLVDAGLG